MEEINFSFQGKDDITGEPLFKREDDAAEVVRRRLEVHDKTEKKVVDYYRWACWSILIIFSSK